MLRHTHLEHRFIHYIPEQLEAGVIYISLDYATAAHSCCCGCGEQVVTPFTPTDWKLIFDGETVSLWPSIGNWNFKCRSHYIVRRSRVFEAERWENKEVEHGRQRDKKRKRSYYASVTEHEERSTNPQAPPDDGNPSFWQRIKSRVQKKRR